ncbi:MAG: prolyl oligopeptidase family serine peptidase [Anaerolineales bacterium]|nr:prolyl oligopeptidase family serine peptidase [Anaerolineales bacterium]
MTATVKTQRPYGLWESPLSPASLSKDLRLSDVAWDTDGSLIWLERRPDRAALVLQPTNGQALRDLNSQYSAAGRLGYGGGDFGVSQGWVYFAEASSGRIYRQPTAGGAPAQPITPGFGSCACPTPSPDGRWLLFLRSYEERDSLEIVDAEGQQWPQKLIAKDDFYMQPTWHPDNRRIAWIAWNHPNMPWDGAELWLGALEIPAGSLPMLKDKVRVAGDERTSVFQPQFSPDGRLLAYVSDADGWQQLYVHDLVSGECRQLTHQPAEHGLPAWIQGLRTYGFDPSGQRIYFLRNQNHLVSLWQIDLKSGDELRLTVGEEYTHLQQIAVSPHGIALIASGSQTPPRLLTLSLPGDHPIQPVAAQVVRRSSSEEFAPDYYSHPQTVQWRSKDGGSVYGLYYPPHHPAYESQGRPPLIVRVHGGPTSQAMASFNNDVQFYTNRGYAVLDVNFRGSTGFGRAYRDLLKGNWGVYDVEDAVSGAQNLVAEGLVDGQRLAILGGSAGGYTVLKALEDYPGFFKAGICLYGITNQFTLALETHKFEKHYNDSLLGPLPEAAALYRERSPIFFAERIRDPLALFQGEEDTAVPRSQLDALVEVLRRRGVPHIYHVYPGEGHGFRKPETLAHYYREVERFLLQHVIFA